MISCVVIFGEEMCTFYHFSVAQTAFFVVGSNLDLQSLTQVAMPTSIHNRLKQLSNLNKELINPIDLYIY